MHQIVHLENATAFVNAATIECEPAAPPTHLRGEHAALTLRT